MLALLFDYPVLINMHRGQQIPLSSQATLVSTALVITHSRESRTDITSSKKFIFPQVDKSLGFSPKDFNDSRATLSSRCGVQSGSLR
jgi:hypothetical protein